MRSTPEFDEVADLLAKMVAIPSVNPRDRHLPAEQALAEFVAGWLAAEGLDVTMDPVLPGRPNVVARYPGWDRAEGALLLESHLDTVEIEGMTVSPFGAEIRGDRLFGRGSCDAKASLAAYMLAMVGVARENRRPRVNVILAAFMGEEYLALGAKHFVAGRPNLLAAVVGEPTSLRAVIACKGVIRFRVQTVGRAAHSSRPWEGDNAIDRMAGVIVHLRGQAAGFMEAQGHPLVGRRSHTVTRVEGGVASNVVPNECTIEVSRRLLPGEDPEAIWVAYQSDLEALAPGRVVVERPLVVASALQTDPASAIVQGLTRCQFGAKLDPEPVGVDFASDASVIAAYGVPTVIFGPGSISDAHQPDESVRLADVDAARRVIKELIETFDPGC